MHKTIRMFDFFSFLFPAGTAYCTVHRSSIQRGLPGVSEGKWDQSRRPQPEGIQRLAQYPGHVQWRPHSLLQIWKLQRCMSHIFLLNSIKIPCTRCRPMLAEIRKPLMLPINDLSESRISPPVSQPVVSSVSKANCEPEVYEQWNDFPSVFALLNNFQTFHVVF